MKKEYIKKMDETMGMYLEQEKRCISDSEKYAAKREYDKAFIFLLDSMRYRGKAEKIFVDVIDALIRENETNIRSKKV